MSYFGERLSELIFEHNLTTEKLAAELGVSRPTVIRWTQNKLGISLHNAIRIADFFKCSLEFLIGRTENTLDFALHPYQPFYERLRQVMNERGVTWYRIVKDGIVSNHNMSVWKNGASPNLQSVVDIAEYFEYTLDQFVGREK